MARLLTDPDDEYETHLRHSKYQHKALCGAESTGWGRSEGTLSCHECAEMALHAIETSTKQERRMWRELE